MNNQSILSEELIKALRKFYKAEMSRKIKECLAKKKAKKA